MIRNFMLAYVPSWYDALGEWLDEPKAIYRYVYSQAKSKCQLCGNKAASIYPITSLDFERKEIVFTRFIAVCAECNDHLKLSALHEDEAEVTSYLQGLLKKKSHEVEKMIAQAHHDYVLSNNWKMDMSLIAETIRKAQAFTYTKPTVRYF